MRVHNTHAKTLYRQFNAILFKTHKIYIMVYSERIGYNLGN